MDMATRFGYCAPIFAAPGACLFRTPNYPALDPAVTMDLCRQAEALGYDSLWVADHLMLGQDDAILEGWTTLAALAGATRRIRLGVIHYANLMRHPSMTAKMTATLDQISGGRLIHFFDGGNNRREHVAYGLPWSEKAEERIARMGESLELTLALWTAHEAVTYRGRFYHVEGARCRPAPVQRPHPPVWLGEAHPAMLELCARHAQGWNTTPVPLPELDRRLAALHAACAQAGRPYEELEKSFETQVLIAPDRAGLRRALERILARGAAPPDPAIAAYARGDEDRVPTSLDQAFLIGTPDEVDARIRTYLERGISHFLLWFMDAPETEGLELFATEVAPRFR